MNDYLTVKKAFAITILSLLLAGLLTSSTTYFFSEESSEEDRGNARLAPQAALVVGELLLILPLMIFLAGKADIRKTLRLNAVPAATVRTTLILSLGAAILADELDRLVTLIFPTPQWLQEIAQPLRAEDATSLILLFSGGVIIAAITEELLFRGFLQHVLERQWQDVTRAVLVTSLFFAIIHVNPGWIIQIYLLGILLGYLAWKTNSTFPSMIFHGINNGLAFVFANWGEHIDSWYTWKGHVSPAVLVGGAVLAVAGFRQIAARH